ncbi:MAG: outer membrane lipoprotein carrier protein LolA [Myxococcales bacterium]|nr:outer membrane lipoprotein carrier protein LolA [Myxococcales bacterium]
MRRVRSVAVTLLPICWAICSGDSLASAANDPAPTELEALMEFFAGSGGVRARFQESRHLSILTDPIETTGTLYFNPPDRLARHVTRPGRSSVVIEAGRVSFGDETGQRVFDFDTSEVARALVGNLMVVFRGDLESLRARYSISFDSDGENWTLDLEPRSRALRGIIERIRFTGQGRKLTAMETRESNGDRTIMRFSEIEIGLSWEPGDLDRIFSLDPPDATP